MKFEFKKQNYGSISSLEFAEKNNIENPCAVKIDGELFDLNHKLDDDCEVNILSFNDNEGRKVYSHSSCHIMAQAVKRIYPNAKLGFGPPTDSGFFYDIDFGDKDFSRNDIPKIENEIKKIISENFEIKRQEISISDAKKLMQDRNEPYKLELLNDLEKKQSSAILRTQGEFVDICSGPHLPSTGLVGCIHITNVTGAYWKGNEKNKMLTRIYGVSFPSEQMYQDYLSAVEESKNRDHNKIGRSLGYFTTVDYIGQGLPILLPRGARTVQLMQRFIEDEEEKRGYLLTKTPFLAKSDLYKISGHWYHYKENMFILGEEKDESEQFALRPMTCPFQFQVFLNRDRSYRDLPMRLNETSTLFRNEQSGEMHGLIRLRQFTISEGHIACTPEQLANEFKECLHLAQFVMRTFKIEDEVYYRFSKWDENNREKYIGSADEWEKVQNEMRSILDSCGLDYEEADGEAAFYGPKLDIQFKNVYGKEDTLITIQIDFQLAKKFDMVYTDKDGSKKYAYVIHRTSLGCYERTLALLLEKYKGLLPLWISPEQIRILPMNENLVKNAEDLRLKLIEESKLKRIEIDYNNEKIGYKIRQAQEEKVPYMIVLGSKEVAGNTLSVRSNKKGDLGSMSFDDFVNLINKEINNKE